MAQPMKGNVPTVGLSIKTIIRQYEKSHCRHLVGMKQQKIAKHWKLNTKFRGQRIILFSLSLVTLLLTVPEISHMLLHTAKQFVTGIKLG